MSKLAAILILSLPIGAAAQPVAKAVVAEHFTNTFCSICATRNPGLSANLAQYPQVFHISYYPSSPYPACPINQSNKQENDDHTNFYGIYGATPKLVVQGAEVTGSFTDATIFSSQQGQTTAFEVTTTLKDISATDVEVRTVIRKKDASTLTALTLYGVIAEDTLTFTANNGEKVLYDVFRKAIWGSQPTNVTAPSAIGDSLVYTKQVSINTSWNKARLYALAMLQQPDKKMVQAGRSARMAVATGINKLSSTSAVVYPNPVTDVITFSNIKVLSSISISGLTGAVIKTIETRAGSAAIAVDDLAPGLYIATITNDEGKQVMRFVKN